MLSSSGRIFGRAEVQRMPATTPCRRNYEGASITITYSPIGSRTENKSCSLLTFATQHTTSLVRKDRCLNRSASSYGGMNTWLRCSLTHKDLPSPSSFRLGRESKKAAARNSRHRLRSRPRRRSLRSPASFGKILSRLNRPLSQSFRWNCYDVTEKSRAPALDVSNWSDILRDADKDSHGRK